jgi:hypothetical protein
MVEENVNVAEPVAQTPTATPEPEPVRDDASFKLTVAMPSVKACFTASRIRLILFPI